MDSHRPSLRCKHLNLCLTIRNNKFQPKRTPKGRSIISMRKMCGAICPRAEPIDVWEENNKQTALETSEQDI